MNYCQLARDSLEYWLSHHRYLPVEERVGMAAGCFVSLHTRSGELRGCVGTIQPYHDDLAQEIVVNAVTAATRDNRFPSVTADELEQLVLEVSVLQPPEAITGKHLLDPKRYGVIVQSGNRRGLLLPDLDGVDSVDDQISIAKRKASIGEHEDVELCRFTVEKYHE